jgi:CRISPR/Cas system-associated exonuclease Cas4 (RecB family)
MTKDPLSINYNQSNLQDFKECPRRFQLKHLEEISWPSATSMPLSEFERVIQLGNQFHHLAHQYLVGIKPELIQTSIQDAGLVEMWNKFIDFVKSLSGCDLFSEQTLHTTIKGHTVIAKFDLIVKKADQYIIFDWKTSQNIPPLSYLSDRAQTLLYPYILLISGSELFGDTQIKPGQILFNYFYPLSSDPVVSIPYSEKIHKEFDTTLANFIDTITSLYNSENNFPLTTDHSKCNLCQFRSICNRGIEAADLSIIDLYDWEDLSDVQFDIDNIQELEY